MNPLLLNLPTEFTTQRLLIRVPRQGDGFAISQAVNESLNELKVYMPWAQTPNSTEDSEMFARRSHARFILRETLNFVAFRLEDGEFVSGIGFPRLDWDVPKFELGYWCRTSMSGKGYITEAANCLTNVAFQIFQAKRVEIHCDSRNIASANVARRCGYPLEGIHKKDALDVNGLARDTMVFAKVTE
jgi:RimJ/RimL family protein N-acetyltransferase